MGVSVADDEDFGITKPRIIEVGDDVVTDGGEIARLVNTDFVIKFAVREDVDLGDYVEDVEFFVHISGEEKDISTVYSERYGDGVYALYEGYFSSTGVYSLEVESSYGDNTTTSSFDLLITADSDFETPNIRSVSFVTDDSVVGYNETIGVYMSFRGGDFNASFDIDRFGIYEDFEEYDDGIAYTEFELGYTEVDSYDSVDVEIGLDVEGGLRDEKEFSLFLGCDREDSLVRPLYDDGVFVVSYLDEFVDVSHYLDDKILNLVFDYNDNFYLDMRSFTVYDYDGWFSSRSGIKCIVSGTDYSRITYLIDSYGGDLSRFPLFSDLEIRGYNDFLSFYGIMPRYDVIDYQDDYGYDTIALMERGIDENQIKIYYD